jgi:hypothetical protein
VTLERASLFRQPSNLNYLAGDLITLGCTDAGAWGKRGKSWSEELRAACPRLKGKRFTGKVEPNGQYANLYINALIGEGESASPFAVAFQGAAAAAAPSLYPAPRAATEDIPF